MRINTNEEGAMRYRIAHWWLLAACLSLAPCGAPAAVESPRPFLAIMDFTNQNLDDAEWQWLSKGLSDMLTTDLARADTFQVVDRAAIREYLEELALGDTGLVDQQAALKLGRMASVGKALFGNYEIDNKRIVIQAYIIDIASNDVELVATIAGPVADVLDLENALALRILENLSVPLTQAEIDSIRFKPTDSLDATTRFYEGLDAYDRGRYFDALRQFRLAENADETYDKPLLFQGYVFEHLGEYDHAILAFKTLATRVPGSMFAVEGWFIAAKLSANEFQNYGEALRIADLIIDRYPDGRLRDGTVVAQKHEPAPAIIIRGSYRRYSIVSIMRMYKSSLYVRIGDYGNALREAEESAQAAPEPYLNANVHYLRELVEFAYVQTGQVLIPTGAPNVIELNPKSPVYAEDYSSRKRFADSFELESTDSDWGREVLKPYGYDDKTQQHYISNKYSTGRDQWYTTGDKYLFAAPEGYVVDSVDVWLEGYQTEPWTLDALVVSVGDYNSKGATGGPRKGHTKDYYRAPVLTGTRLFRLLIQVAGHFTKPIDQFAYISRWKIRANLRKVGATASLQVKSNTPVLVFVNPITGQVRDAQSIHWRSNPSMDCPCRINNLPAGSHRLVAFAAGQDRSIQRDGRRRELVVDVVPDRANEIVIDYPLLQSDNEAGEVLPGWGDFHRVLGGFARVGAGGKVNQLEGLQSRDGTYQLLFTRDFDIWFATSADGLTWTDATPLPGPINSQSLEEDFAIVQGKDGRYFITFLSARGGSNALYVSSSGDLKRWRKPRKVASLKSLHGRPSLLQLRDGTFRIYFAPRNHRVTYVASRDFVTWTAGSETKVEHQNFAQVVLDESGTFWLLYGGYEGRNHLLFVASSTDGDNWQELRRVDVSDARHSIGSFHPTLVPTTRGLAMAWQRTTRLAFSRTRDGADWSPSSAARVSGGKLGYPRASFAFFRRLDDGYMLVFHNSYDELWSATSRNPFQ